MGIRYGSPNDIQSTLSKVRNIFGEGKPYRRTPLRHLSAPASDRRPPDTIKALIKKKKPFSKKAQNSLNIERPSIAKGRTFINEYQSYPHKNNSCYVTAPLEILYALYLSHMEAWKQASINLSDKSGIMILLRSFHIRDKAYATTAKNKVELLREVQIKSFSFFKKNYINIYVEHIILINF
jgi:hypothetical protein